MEAFWAGFEKQANAASHLKKLAPAAAVAAGLAGLGAFSGHAAHVAKKMDSARRGEDYKEKSFIEKHPKLTGAASLGLAPAFSLAKGRQDKDMNSEKVRSVMKAHPFMGKAVGGHLT